MSHSYYFVDTIGLGDNRLHYNEAGIRNHIEKEIIKIAANHKVDAIDAIVVTESIKADAISLPIIFQQIYNILGQFPSESVIVLGTKKNDCNSVAANIRTTQILQTMSDFGIPTKKYMDFYTPCPEINFNENKINNSQYNVFQNLISSCPRVPLESIAQKQRQIHDRAA
jgi:hypothetical protein